jgi:4-diphosphocytidyl-2-C-methyl-D-erythritol kinase
VSGSLPGQPLTTRAPAKINLSLHILGRRADGYHELESLVAFAGSGDTLSLSPDEPLSLHVAGPTASSAGVPDKNLVLKATRTLLERMEGLRAGAFHLVKRLPAAAGVGGGSSDAAAALRLLACLNRLALDHPIVVDAARATGADVPVCLAGRARMMRGAGEHLGPPLNLPCLFAVLVNPGVPLETARVFQALGLQPGERSQGEDRLPIDSGLTAGDLLDRLARARNDLERPALALAPLIGEALERLREAPGCRLARMSGSGATVFGLFDDCAGTAAAARLIRRAKPDWWVKGTSLR